MLDFFFSSRRRHTRWNCDWSSDVCSSDLIGAEGKWQKDELLTPFGPMPGAEVHLNVLNSLLHRESVRDLSPRSEERRVGKECRSRWWADHQKKETTA